MKAIRCADFVRAATAVAAALLLTIALTGRAEAAIIASTLDYWSGNTNPGPGPFNVNSPTGSINFGIVDNAGIGALSGSAHTGTLDTSANYLYAYQITMNAGTDIVSVTIDLNSTLLSSATSYGFFNGLGFSDNSGEVTPSNVFGGPDSPGTVFSTTDPANIPVVGGTIGNLTAGTYLDPNTGAGAAFAVVLSQSSIQALFNSSPSGNLTPAAGSNRSSIFYFTSNRRPTLGDGSFQDHGSAAVGTVITPTDGQIIVPTPEPTSLVVWGLGLGLVVGTGAMRRRKQIA